MKRKANISIELQASKVTNGFDIDHKFDLWILKVKCDLDLWPHTWPWPWIFMVKFWNSCISEWEGRLTLHKGGGSRSFMTMTMTIWGPRSGVWIYQIVTGVTSVVSVPSTHLVIVIEISNLMQFQCHLLWGTIEKRIPLSHVHCDLVVRVTTSISAVLYCLETVVIETTVFCLQTCALLSTRHCTIYCCTDTSELFSSFNIFIHVIFLSLKLILIEKLS